MATEEMASDDERVVKTDTEWRRLLTDEQYRVARLGGTERPFGGVYADSKDAGTYRCICCDAPLFESDTKYDSGTGWPSFWQPVGPQALTVKSDRSHGMIRQEVCCARCDAHLGHVFDDGPQPTGKRYCMNSASLSLAKAQGSSDGA